MFSENLSARPFPSDFSTPNPASVTVRTPAAGPQRILVVDDEPEICQLHGDILSYHGFEVDLMDNGVSAWKALQLNRYDLLLTDHKMGGLTGVELIKLLHAKGMDMCVVLATGVVPDPSIPNFLPQISVLMKPYSVDVLVRVVKEALANHRNGEVATTHNDWL